ncbi:MAG: hypothetical protein J4G09_15015 [Proteobacteria bacterium]|nr:hypothetical protein [Pseudomonadota bacterium]
MRVLVTNDDGVHSPGLNCLARALREEGHDVLIAAPLGEQSGAAAAIGDLLGDGGIRYERVALPGFAEAFGVDGPPARAVWAACLGGWGEPPELIVSGINLGNNCGRSVIRGRPDRRGHRALGPGGQHRREPDPALAARCPSGRARHALAGGRACGHGAESELSQARLGRTGGGARGPAGVEGDGALRPDRRRARISGTRPAPRRPERRTRERLGADPGRLRHRHPAALDGHAGRLRSRGLPERGALSARRVAGPAW